jgi:hypothetical protein
MFKCLFEGSFGFPYNCFYSPHYNFVYSPDLFGSPAYNLLYLGLVIAACVIYLFSRKKNLVHALLTASWLLWAGIVGMQVLHQNWYVSVLQKNLALLTDDQKNKILFEDSYKTARFFSSLVSRGSSGDVFTDMSVFDRIEPNVLPYFFYPQMNLFRRVPSPEYRIFFFKEHIKPADVNGFTPVAIIDPNISLWKRTDNGK